MKKAWRKCASTASKMDIVHPNYFNWSSDSTVAYFEMQAKPRNLKWSLNLFVLFSACYDAPDLGREGGGGRMGTKAFVFNAIRRFSFIVNEFLLGKQHYTRTWENSVLANINSESTSTFLFVEFISSHLTHMPYLNNQFQFE